MFSDGLDGSALDFCAQSALDEHQVGQGEEAVELRGVLGRSTRAPVRLSGLWRRPWQV